MTLVSVVYYVAMICPLVWLVWLASRPFLVNLNRLLLVIMGMVLYGWLARTCVIPLTDVANAYIEANRLSGNLAPDQGPIFRLIAYVGIPLAVVLLLMQWLQRVLARSPHRNPD